MNGAYEGAPSGFLLGVLCKYRRGDTSLEFPKGTPLQMPRVAWCLKESRSQQNENTHKRNQATYETCYPLETRWSENFTVVQLCPYRVILKTQQLDILVRGIVTLNKSALHGKWL